MHAYIHPCMHTYTHACISTYTTHPGTQIKLTHAQAHDRNYHSFTIKYRSRTINECLPAILQRFFLCPLHKVAFNHDSANSSENVDVYVCVPVDVRACRRTHAIGCMVPVDVCTHGCMGTCAWVRVFIMPPPRSCFQPWLNELLC